MAANDNGDPTLDYYGGRQQQQPSAAPYVPLPPAGPIPTNPDGTQVSGGWNAGASAPNPVPGYHWDANYAMYVKDPDGPVPTPTPGPTSGPTSGGNTGQGLFSPALYAPFQGTPPTYQGLSLPGFPTPPKPPAFSYKDFVAPTLDEASKQPGYQFGLQQGEQALQQSRAAQGLLRTGGTLKDILDYGRNAATQNYSNVLNQDLGIYNTNRAGAVQDYNTNYKTQYQDQYAPQILKYQTEAAAAQHENDSQNNRAWQQYLNSQDTFFNNENAPFSKYLSLAQLGAANA